MTTTLRLGAAASARPQVKKKAAAASALALALLLGACSGGAQNTGLAVTQVAANATQVTLSPEALAQARQTCAQAAPALAVATSSAVPATVSGTAIYPAALCADLAKGIVPPTADASTPQWLAKTLSVTQDVATAAGVILPIALKALPLVAALL